MHILRRNHNSSKSGGGFVPMPYSLIGHDFRSGKHTSKTGVIFVNNPFYRPKEDPPSRIGISMGMYRSRKQTLSPHGSGVVEQRWSVSTKT